MGQAILMVNRRPKSFEIWFTRLNSLPLGAHISSIFTTFGWLHGVLLAHVQGIVTLLAQLIGLKETDWVHIYFLPPAFLQVPQGAYGGSMGPNR